VEGLIQNPLVMTRATTLLNKGIAHLVEEFGREQARCADCADRR
jgi:hypothetical protein